MNPSHWTVVCDFDGTITPNDVTDDLLARFAPPAWLDVEMQWRRGEIGARTCMSRQVALIECSRAELDAFSASVDIDPGFPGFVAAVTALGWDLVIASDGLDRVCRSILDRHGFTRLPVFANRLVPVTERRWLLDFPHAVPGCASGHCKCERAFAAAVTGPVLLVGDGASDFCVARQADFVLARGALYEHCVAFGIACEGIEDLAEATRLLPIATRHAFDTTAEPLLP